LHGFINSEFAGQYYDEFLHEVGAGIADGRIRYREDIVDSRDKAPRHSLECWTGAISQLIVRVE
jgi:NADPH-dependent curcumin reductase CurA